MISSLFFSWTKKKKKQQLHVQKEDKKEEREEDHWRRRGVGVTVLWICSWVVVVLVKEETHENEFKTQGVTAQIRLPSLKQQCKHSGG